MIPPTSIDGTDITGATIDGTDVTEITVDGQTVFTAAPAVPDQSNLVFHLDASQESLSNNQTTTTVTDFSGNNNDFTGDSVTYKTNQVNGLPAFEFDDDSLTNNQSVSDPLIIAVVLELTSSGHQMRLFGSDSTFSDFTVQIETGQFTPQYKLTFGGSSIGYITNPPLNQYLTVIYEADGSNSAVHVDGVEEATGSVGSKTVTGLNLGTTEQNSSRGLKGNLAELLLYGSATNITNLENYLQARYATF